MRPSSVLILFVLSGCSATPASVNPVQWWHDLEGGAIAEQRPPAPGATDPYPNLATVPPRPPTTDPVLRSSIANALVADRTSAQYAASKAPLTDPSSPSASPALFGQGTLPPPPGGQPAAKPGAGQAAKPAATPPAEPATASLEAASAKPSQPPPTAGPAPTQAARPAATPPAEPATASLEAVSAKPAQPPPPPPKPTAQKAPQPSPVPSPVPSAVPSPASAPAQNGVGAPLAPPGQAVIDRPSGLEASDLPPIPGAPPAQANLPGIPAGPTKPTEAPKPPPAPPPPPPKPPVAGPATLIDFPPGSAVLTSAGADALRRFAQSRGGAVVAVSGYGDIPSGDPAAQSDGVRLGLLRAQAMAGVLASAGVPVSAVRIDAEASGHGGAVRLIN